MSSGSIHASARAKIGEGGWPVTLMLLLMSSWYLLDENFFHASPIQAQVKSRLSEADSFSIPHLSKFKSRNAWERRKVIQVFLTQAHGLK